MRELNYGTKRERPKDDKGRELIKNQECVSCENLFTCKGKPREVRACLNYKERANSIKPV